MVDDTESFEEGANISEVVRRHEVVRPPLTMWSRQMSRTVGVKTPGFVPVRIDPAALPTVAHANPTSAGGQCPGRIEIEERGSEYGALCSPAMAFRAIRSRTRNRKA